MNTKPRLLRLCILGNFAVAAALACWFAFYPAARIAPALPRAVAKKV